MGWETREGCIKSDQSGSERGIAVNNKVTLFDYFNRFPALSYHPTHSTLTFVCLFYYFFLSLPHTSVGIVEFNLLSSVRGLNHAIGFTYVSRSGPEVPLSREEEVDSTLLKNDSGVESALLYAKACSKYLKDLLAWMEKRLAMGKSRRDLKGSHWWHHCTER